jgi:hypothetical protein
VFPDPQHAPFNGGESIGHLAITSFVDRKFPAPEGSITPRFGGMQGAAMPEASVHEYRDFKFGEDEVRFAEQDVIASPAGNVLASQQIHKSEFRRSVATPMNPRHHLRPFCFGENIGHIIRDCFCLQVKSSISTSVARIHARDATG